jgi:hypothetical protein
MFTSGGLASSGKTADRFHPQTSLDRVSDTVEVTNLDLDYYLATPTALTSPSFSVRPSLCSGVEVDSATDLGDCGRFTNPRTNPLTFFTSGNTLGLQRLPLLTITGADGALRSGSSLDCSVPHRGIGVCTLRLWISVTYRFGLGLAFNHRLFDPVSHCHPPHSTRSRSVSCRSV